MSVWETLFDVSAVFRLLMASLLSFNSLTSTLGALRSKKRFQFDVRFDLVELENCTFITGVLFGKIQLKDGGNFTGFTDRLVPPHLPDHSCIANSCRTKGALCARQLQRNLKTAATESAQNDLPISLVHV